MFIYIYIINIHRTHTHTHILCKQKLLFWMWLIAINLLTALIYIYVYICMCIYIYIYIYIYILYIYIFFLYSNITKFWMIVFHFLSHCKTSIQSRQKILHFVIMKMFYALGFDRLPANSLSQCNLRHLYVASCRGANHHFYEVHYGEGWNNNRWVLLYFAYFIFPYLQNLKESEPKHIIIYLPSCCSKTMLFYFIHRTQKKKYWII